ncbi:MAG: TRAP transporter fused permease subunit [Deltaproteobacteria bacterium]|nr:TRAP transporter fused permease subunit [Deltaproteobacteria bacterium]
MDEKPEVKQKIAQPQVEEDLPELDSEADKDTLKELVSKDSKSGRGLTGFWYWLVAGMGTFMVVFYMYNAGIASVDTQYYFGVYVLLTYAMVFLSYPMLRNSPQDRPSVLDVLLALVAVFCVGYYIHEYADLNYRMGAETNLDIAVSAVGILISLEVARRVLGASMTIVGVVFLCYCLWGDVLQGIPVLDAFSHQGTTFKKMTTDIFLKQDGVFGIMTSVLVNYVILFIFFGSFLKYSGCAKFFLDLPLALAGNSVGGPAKVAVIASGFFGSVSGSAIANTVSTGAFTIPLMKRTGFKPHVAGAIEPAASIGGMFMPPIMGAGGFIMAEMTGVSYVEIMKMAVFPAVIYFLSVYVMVHFEAKRYGIRGERDPNAPTAWQILKAEWFLSLPLVIIVVIMLLGYSPGMAAFLAIISCVVVSWFTGDHRMGPKEIMLAMIEGSRNTLIIGATVGVIGIIVGAIAMTGIGLKFSEIIINLSQGILPLAIILIGLASLVLGMGVPVTAAYLITIVLTQQAVTNMLSMTWFNMSYADLTINTDLTVWATWVTLASHMIVYWFSQDSNITPPVCVAAYAGAAIAGADPWKTGWTSFKFAKMLYMGPFLFAFAPGFLLFGTWYNVILAILTIVLGTIAFGSLTMGYFLCPMTIVEWALMAVATLLLFFPEFPDWLFHFNVPKLFSDFAGIGLWLLVWLIQKYRIKSNPNLTLPLEERRALHDAAKAGGAA